MDDDSDFHEELELGVDTEDVAPSQAEYYDPTYYDSDDDAQTDESEEEQWNDEDDDQSTSGRATQLNNHSDPVMESITRKLKASSMSGDIEAPSKKIQRKHRVKSNDQLLYDPEQDELDQEWLFDKIAGHRPKGTKREDIWTDAILVCPMCWTTLCYDCQQHEFYPHQFRAMFVENCRTIQNEALKFPKAPSTKAQQKKAMHPAKAPTADTTTDPTPDAPDTVPQFHPDSPDVFYHPVVCESCNTKVAVVDSDEIYHFFHVIASDIHPLKH
ncbi:hypothetical protein DFQ26_006736 [Actinomortierella ambigua]|nr:hypothetical protein DFQ26_006736 [Actinomortierella ambigua]